MSHGLKLAQRRLLRIIAPVTLSLAVAGPVAVVQAAATSSAMAASTTAVAPGASGATATAAVRATPTATRAVYFRTLPPGAKLPTGAACAKLVNATPRGESKAANKPYNQRKGSRVGSKFFPTTPGSDNPLAQKRLAPRINGDFTGTTIDILRWAACKWGIDQDIVFAQAAVESWWQQDTLGDFGTDAAACLPGHKIGQDGQPGECPQSYGILQNRYPYEDGGWPAIARSTAMNADAAYAIWRACYDGYETWLNTVPRGAQYKAGDGWGCVGRWFAGRWRTSAALGYIAKVKQYRREKIWLTPDFRQMS
jgi:hypothetical protein